MRAPLRDDCVDFRTSALRSCPTLIPKKQDVAAGFATPGLYALTAPVYDTFAAPLDSAAATPAA